MQMLFLWECRVAFNCINISRDHVHTNDVSEYIALSEFNLK